MCATTNPTDVRPHTSDLSDYFSILSAHHDYSWVSVVGFYLSAYACKIMHVGPGHDLSRKHKNWSSISRNHILRVQMWWLCAYSPRGGRQRQQDTWGSQVSWPSHLCTCMYMCTYIHKYTYMNIYRLLPPHKNVCYCCV